MGTIGPVREQAPAFPQGAPAGRAIPGATEVAAQAGHGAKEFAPGEGRRLEAEVFSQPLQPQRIDELVGRLVGLVAGGLAELE